MLGDYPRLRARATPAPLVVGGARPAPAPAGRTCPCGNRLSRYNREHFCHACQVADQERRAQARREAEARLADRHGRRRQEAA